MKEMFDGRGNVIRDGDRVKCCLGMESSRVPHTSIFVGNLLAGEVLGFSGCYVNVLAVETEGVWEPGISFYLKPEQVVVVDDDAKGFDLDSFNQMLGIGGRQ